MKKEMDSERGRERETEGIRGRSQANWSGFPLTFIYIFNFNEEFKANTKTIYQICITRSHATT